MVSVLFTVLRGGLSKTEKTIDPDHGYAKILSLFVYNVYI